MEEFILTDYIFVCIVLLSTLFGFARGFIRELFTVLNLVLAGYATYFSYSWGYDFFAGYFEDALVIEGAAIGSLFLVWWIIIAILNSFVLDLIASFKGGFLDRILGTAFGVFRGAVIVIAVYVGTALAFNAQTEDDNLPAWLKDAGTLNYVKMQSQNFIEFMPKEYAEIYYSEKENALDRMVDSLQRDDGKEDEKQSKEEKDTAKSFINIGFKKDDVATLQQIYKELPVGYDATLSLKEIAQLDKELIKIYGEQLLDDYVLALREGKVKPNISQQSLDSLTNAFSSISTNTQLN